MKNQIWECKCQACGIIYKYKNNENKIIPRPNNLKDVKITGGFCDNCLEELLQTIPAQGLA